MTAKEGLCEDSQVSKIQSRMEDLLSGGKPSGGAQVSFSPFTWQPQVRALETHRSEKTLPAAALFLRQLYKLESGARKVTSYLSVLWTSKVHSTDRETTGDGELHLENPPPCKAHLRRHPYCCYHSQSKKMHQQNSKQGENNSSVRWRNKCLCPEGSQGLWSDCLC